MNRLERIRSRVEEKHQLIPRIDVEDLVKVVEAAKELFLSSAEGSGNPTPADVYDVLAPVFQPLLEEEEE